MHVTHANRLLYVLSNLPNDSKARCFFCTYDESSEYRFIRSGLLVFLRGAATSIRRTPVNRMLVLALQFAWLNSIPGYHPQSDSAQYKCKTCPEDETVSLKITLSPRKCRSSFPYYTTVWHTSSFDETHRSHRCWLTGRLPILFLAQHGIIRPTPQTISSTDAIKTGVRSRSVYLHICI